MKEKPILFNAAMVRAVLDGRKTQTRRVIKPQPQHDAILLSHLACTAQDGVFEFWGDSDYSTERVACPYGASGDRLWVRETFAHLGCYRYRATETEGVLRRCTWKPSIHMPRCASRINLEVVGVRVERVQDISDGDALAEGIMSTDFWGKVTGDMLPDDNEEKAWEEYPRQAFRLLWDSINAKPRKDGTDISWTANPWVWVVEFRRLK